jgi:hypothetical protein
MKIPVLVFSLTSTVPERYAKGVDTRNSIELKEGPVLSVGNVAIRYIPKRRR